MFWVLYGLEYLPDREIYYIQICITAFEQQRCTDGTDH